MRRAVNAALLSFLLALGSLSPAWAAQDLAPILKELKALKARVAQLEAQVKAAQDKADAAQAQAGDAKTRADAAQAHSLKVSEKVQEQPGWLSGLAKRVNATGALEFEASYERFKPKGSKAVENSDLALATAEIIFELDIHKYAKGVIHFLWEQGDEAIGLDEGFILLGQTEDMPFYLLAGRMYPAIGVFDTAMISDPITQNVFETQATALEVGYSHGWFSLGAGAYRSEVATDSDDTHINTYFARLSLTPPAEALGGVELAAGVALTNNIAGSDTLSELVPGPLDRLVAGWSANLAVTYGIFTLYGEYISALESFRAGELDLAPAGDTPRPWAFNLELAVQVLEPLTVAARYEGGGDLYELEPERQYGLALAYALMEHVTLSLEYLHGEYQNDDTRDLVTGQMALEF